MSHLIELARRSWRTIAAAVIAAGLAPTAPALAQPVPSPGVAQGTAPGTAATATARAPIPLELNKLEASTQGGAGCLFYFLVSNPDSDPIERLQVDLIIFSGDGIIARRVALELGPLPPKKQAVRLFDLKGLACDDVGRVLINDVMACAQKGGASTDADRAACLDRLTLTSRTKAQLNR